MAIWKERIRRAGHAIQEQLGAGAGELRQVIDAQIATVNGVATVYELIRERHGQSSRYWMRSGDKEWPIGNDAAVFIRQQWAIGQPVDLDLT